MVKLEEVADEHFEKGTADEGDWDTDSDTSDASSTISETSPADESLLDRLTALKDVIPPARRRRIANTLGKTTSWSWWGASGLAKVSWYVGVSAMLLVAPFGMTFLEETMQLQEEQQQQMQQSAKDVLTQGSSSDSNKTQASL